ncbi:MAG: hypothetical protein NC094_09035 [Bacteroidales bacterium]|nr:hypothetical protein [Lachnoclostridium sp.]MCM1385148.1 hypothetical protein [Lachnoclostridium sp.]MCM1465550.1 hypothetical protein [Bacteroidales bacterium]
MLFEKFGEFDSVEELNRAAAAQKAEGDIEALKALALENGLEEEDAEDYMNGCTPELATDLQAAVGKLRAESRDLMLSGVLADWVNELIDMCTSDEAFRLAVRKKGKDLAGYIALTAETGYQARCVVDKKIVSRTKKLKEIIGSYEFSIGIPDKRTRRKLAMDYYMGGEK